MIEVQKELIKRANENRTLSKIEITIDEKSREIIKVEIWKQSILPNYEISNLGRIRNNKTYRIIKTDKNEKGYCKLSIKVNGVTKHYAIHRLVAFAFIPNPLNKPQIDHIDGNKENNCVSNLRWVSNQENAIARNNRRTYEDRR